MPENVQEQPKDLLENLLTEAATRAAKQEAEDALRKGYVTREQINLALDSFGNKLEDSLADKILGAVETQIQATVKKVLESNDFAGLRKGTVITPEEEREADPVLFVLKKAQANPESLDQTDKRIMWAVTEKVLSQGMTLDMHEE